MKFIHQNGSKRTDIKKKGRNLKTCFTVIQGTNNTNIYEICYLNSDI